MYPSRHTLEYMSEMDRLFSRNHEFDLHSPMLSSSSHSFHSIIPSSSSTETSPESYPDITTQRQFQRQDEQVLFDFRHDAFERRPMPDVFERSDTCVRSDTFELRSDCERRPDTFQRRPDTPFETTDTFPKRSGNFQRSPETFERRDNLRSNTPFERCDPFERRPLNFQRSPDTIKRPDNLRRSVTPSERSDTYERLDEHHREVYDTPFIIRRQRPIIGRKIMASTELPKIQESNIIWQPIELPQTPPKSNIYELFPTESKGFELKTPVKSPSYSSSPMTLSPMQMSPSLTSSPKMITSPQMMRTPPRMLIPSPRGFTPFSHYDPIPSSSQNFQNMKMCTFCKKNGETPLVYMAHSLKEKVGNKHIVTCPILRRHVCATCGASGDNAHTITYCPVLRSTNNGQPLRSTTITLKNTRVKSNDAGQVLEQKWHGGRTSAQLKMYYIGYCASAIFVQVICIY